MPLHSRIGLVPLMSLSLFSLAVGIVKMTIVHWTQWSDSAITNQKYSAAIAKLWTNVEQSSVIIMGCVPPLRSLSKWLHPLSSSLARSFPSLLHSNRTKKDHSTAGDTRNRFSVSKFIKLVASICHTHYGTVTTALIAIAAQTSQVLAAAAVDPIVEDCDTLSAMDFTCTAVENVSAEKISICLEHQLSRLGVPHRPRHGEPRTDLREWRIYGLKENCRPDVSGLACG
ncbi:hypothetical protein LA080_007330 [Diaporthe eres]|nr:hypothetical protein LA080_007330 [Diaporthe eres]